MRSTRVYILRLLVDSQLPGRLQGVLFSTSEAAAPRPFRSTQALIDLLNRLVAEPANVQANSPPSTKGEES